MFKSNRRKIVDQIVKVSEKLHDDCRYDHQDAELRLKQLEELNKTFELLTNEPPHNIIN